MTTDLVLQELQALSDPTRKAGMSRFGISTQAALGISMPALRNYAKLLRRNHPLALALWDTGVHEARLLATLLADPKDVTEALMEEWVRGFNSWDLCDQACANLFYRSPLAWQKAVEWAGRVPEFEKRAGFALMAALAVHAKKAPDDQFWPFFPLLEREAGDSRNFVKKAVNWALRQIGKRNPVLHQEAIRVAERIRSQNSPSARWIATDSLRELQSKKVLQKLAAQA